MKGLQFAIDQYEHWDFKVEEHRLRMNAAIQLQTKAAKCITDCYLFVCLEVAPYDTEK